LSIPAQSHDSPYLLDLNAPQRQAVEHFRGPILVLAGAGSGKTRVLTYRVAHLVLHHGVRPGSILAVTFTNKAAGEMKQRLGKLLGDEATALWVSTFHSLGLRLLRRHAAVLQYSDDFVVYDDQDTKTVIKNLLKNQNIDEKRYSVALFRSAIDRFKNQAISVERALEDAGNSYESMIARIYELYQRELLLSNAMDFGDLLVNVLRLFKEDPQVLAQYQHKFTFLLVDEFQDTNSVQYSIIRLLAAPENNILAVGDDDQSIYAFRGATIQNIFDFERDFPGAKVVKLEENYRSTSAILDAAHAVIEKNPERKSKKLWTAKQGGAKISLYCALDEHDEAEFVSQAIQRHLRSGGALSDVACFYRTNAQSRALEEAFMSARIPYRIFGGLKFYDRKEVKDILAYVRLVVNENDNQAFLRIVNNPPRGIGPQTVKNVVDEANQSARSLFAAATHASLKSRPLREFVQLIEELREYARSRPLHTFIAKVVERTEYIARLEASPDPQSVSRVENIKELQAITMLYHEPHREPRELIQAFLDRVSLASSEEFATNVSLSSQNQEETSTQYVSLMTLHLAKGLEYPLVFLVGFEEGLLPHQRSVETALEISEERRLCYVGITRAMDKLYITRARRRGMFTSGDTFGSGVREPSRFAFDIPQTTLEEHANFFDSYDSFIPQNMEILDDIFDPSEPFEQRQSTLKASNRKKVSSIFDPSKLVFSAAHISEKYPPASPHEMTPGAAVYHPSFGAGTVELTEGDPDGDLRKFKVRVLFEGRAGSKNLIFKFAKLSVQ
jgi:DNA helicase-2/ATP-dependent DNA helicase PcrA